VVVVLASSSSSSESFERGGRDVRWAGCVASIADDDFYIVQVPNAPTRSSEIIQRIFSGALEYLTTSIHMLFMLVFSDCFCLFFSRYFLVVFLLHLLLL
jgi:hypothetical protein